MEGKNENLAKKKIENLVKKIRSIRIKKGYSLENVADELGITPAAYIKIEKEITNLTVKRLFCIAEILKTSLEELLEIGNNDVFKKTINESDTDNQQKNENFYQDNKELTQKLINRLESNINYLEKEVLFLRSL